MLSWRIAPAHDRPKRLDSGEGLTPSGAEGLLSRASEARDIVITASNHTVWLNAQTLLTEGGAAAVLRAQ